MALTANEFRFVAASLYSFWLAPSACGASGGYLGGGGPDSVGGRDTKGGVSAKKGKIASVLEDLPASPLLLGKRRSPP